jgi:hypothetical protein
MDQISKEAMAVSHVSLRFDGIYALCICEDLVLRGFRSSSGVPGNNVADGYSRKQIGLQYSCRPVSLGSLINLLCFLVPNDVERAHHLVSLNFL